MGRQCRQLSLNNNKKENLLGMNYLENIKKIGPLIACTFPILDLTHCSLSYILTDERNISSYGDHCSL